MLAKDPLVYLRHIHTCCERLIECAALRRRGDVPERIVLDAVCRNLEILGEASNRVDPEFRAAHPEIVWGIVERDIAPLVVAVRPACNPSGAGGMMPPVRNFGKASGAVVFALALLYFGFLMFMAGRYTLGHWSSIGGGYAAAGVVWILAGPAMCLAGLWVLGSRGRHRMAFWVGGLASVLAGGVLAGGVLTYVIPCSGPG